MINQLPGLKFLPKSLPLEQAVRIELKEGLPIFKASSSIQNRIEKLGMVQNNVRYNNCFH